MYAHTHTYMCMRMNTIYILVHMCTNNATVHTYAPLQIAHMYTYARIHILFGTTVAQICVHAPRYSYDVYISDSVGDQLICVFWVNFGSGGENIGNL